jgi:hypothetical protein
MTEPPDGESPTPSGGTLGRLRLRRFALFAVVFGLPLGGAGSHWLAFLLLGTYAFFGPRQAVEALTLSWALTFLNPGVFPRAAAAGSGRWVVLGCAFLSVLWAVTARRVRPPRAWWWACAFALWAGVTAGWVSAEPLVSVLKLVSFLIAAFTVLLGCELTREAGVNWRPWLLDLFGTLVVLGAPLALHPFGFLRNGRGFQGLLSHPQALGTALSPILAWLVVELLTARRRSGKLTLLALATAVSMFATLARTAALAALVGISAGFAVALAVGRTRSVSVGTWLLRALPVVVAAIAVLATKPEASTERITRYLQKGSPEEELTEIAMAARGAQVTSSWDNFLEHPFTGIGFGTPGGDMPALVTRDPVFGLPVSAPAEKGFAPTGILEEVGIPGGLLFLALAASLLAPALRAGPAAAALCSAALAVNLGEAVFFSVGGIGLLFWVFLGVASTGGVQTISDSALTADEADEAPRDEGPPGDRP